MCGLRFWTWNKMEWTWNSRNKYGMTGMSMEWPEWVWKFHGMSRESRNESGIHPEYQGECKVLYPMHSLSSTILRNTIERSSTRLPNLSNMLMTSTLTFENVMISSHAIASLFLFHPKHFYLCVPDPIQVWYLIHVLSIPLIRWYCPNSLFYSWYTNTDTCINLGHTAKAVTLLVFKQ
jgi:hypothetical protein